MKILTVLTSTALIFGTGTSLVHAREGNPLYVGADIGYGHFNRAIDDESSGAPNESGALSYGLRLGYHLSKSFALELAYTDNGDYEAGEGIACAGSCPPATPAFSEVTTAVRSHGVNAVFNRPIGERLRLNALVGYTQRKADVVDREFSQKRDGALLGAGVSAKVTRRMDVGVEWNIALLSNKDRGTAWGRHMEGSSSVASLGMRFRFW